MSVIAISIVAITALRVAFTWFHPRLRRSVIRFPRKENRVDLDQFNSVIRLQLD